MAERDPVFRRKVVQMGGFSFKHDFIENVIFKIIQSFAKMQQEI